MMVVGRAGWPPWIRWPDKGNHTIFNVKNSEVIDLLDEAWIKKGLPLASDPGVYIVPMGRSIGTAGQTSIRLVTIPGTTEVISAYPV